MIYCFMLLPSFAVPIIIFPSLPFIDRISYVARSSRNKRTNKQQPGLEVKNFDFYLKLKIKPNDWQATNHCALFGFETVLKFYNLEA